MSDANNPVEGHKTDEHSNSGPVDTATQVEAQNLWTQPPPVPPAQLFPKEKKTWGLIEVINSFLIMVCLQIALFLVVMLPILTEQINRGGETLSEAEIVTMTEELQYQPYILILGAFTMYVSWVGMMWYATKFRGRNSFKKDFWVNIKWIDIPAGLAVAVVLFGLVQGISFILTALGVDMSGADNTEPFRNQDFIWQVVLLLGLAGIVGPIAEELFFRGFLMQALIRHYNRGDVDGPRSPFGLAIQRNQAWLFNTYLSVRNWGYRHQYTLSVIISSLIFGFMHFPFHKEMTPDVLVGGLIIVGITGLLGAVFALIALKTRRLGINIFAHIFYNSTVAIYALTAM